MLMLILIHSGGKYETPKMARLCGWSCSVGSHSLVRALGTETAMTPSTESGSSGESAVDTQWGRTWSRTWEVGERCFQKIHIIILMCCQIFRSPALRKNTHTQSCFTHGGLQLGQGGWPGTLVCVSSSPVCLRRALWPAERTESWSSGTICLKDAWRLTPLKEQRCPPALKVPLPNTQ